MALHWLWKNKCGEAVVRFSDGEEHTVNLYQGNAFLIFVNEYKDKDTGEDMYNVWSFFTDEAHAKRMLGLEKGEYNSYANPDKGRIVKIRLNKAKHTKPQKLLDMFIKAFDELKIELYKEETV